MNDLIVVLIILWLVLALAVAWAAEQRKRDAACWFALALLLSPLFALVLLVVAGDGKIAPESPALHKDISEMRARREYERVRNLVP
jgi:formate hydrogenlyase subunit 3/multisubunit Na+/H+ antiporter MnhD subunit